MSFLLSGAVILGFIAGSFLTVMVARLGTGETVIWGRSRCDRCGKKLSWYELLPVLSFIAQDGQCRSCAKPIPRAYPAIELLTALSFLAVAWAVLNGIANPPPFIREWGGGAGQYSNEAVLSFTYYAFFMFVAVGVSFYDAEYKRIPASLIYILAAVGLAAEITGAFRFSDLYPFLWSVAAALGAFLSFWSLWFFSKGRAMGRGDADVALAIALYLGPVLAVAAFFMAFWLGAVFGLAGLLYKRLNWKSEIAFAPFLFGGAAVALFIPMRFIFYHWLAL